MYSASLLPPELDALIRRELESGETVRWMEQPIPRYWSGGSVSAFVFGIPWTGFAIFWTCGAAGFRLPDFSHGFGFFPLFGLPFILIGFGMLSAPLWNYRKALKTVYAVTDRRVILVEGGRKTAIHSFRPHELGHIFREENADGSGDLILQEYTARDGDRVTNKRGMFNIANVAGVERAVRLLIPTPPPTVPTVPDADAENG